MRKSRSLALFVGFTLLCAIATAILLAVRGQMEPVEEVMQSGGYEARTGSRFLALPANPFQAPQVRELSIPQFANATSVWGATGRDSRGHIWVGVSASSSGMSAHLLRYDPEADAWRDSGAVVEKLKAAGRYRDGEGQIKIHSKIVPADDGWLYFASTDEEGESDVAMVPPRWAGIFGGSIRAICNGSTCWRFAKGWSPRAAVGAMYMRWVTRAMCCTNITYRQERQSRWPWARCTAMCRAIFSRTRTTMPMSRG